MKKKKHLSRSKLSEKIAGLGLAVLLFSSCHVVVPSFAPSTEFGYNMSGDFDPEEPYVTGLLQCKTELYPNIIFPTEEATMPANYVTILNNAYPGWTFNNATTTLSDDAIEIKTYDAVGTSMAVGVWIHARYVPHGSDPTDNIHWVQLLMTNHGLKGTGHGPSASYLDAQNASTTTPYYDDQFAADSRDIIDKPTRVDANLDHTWEATTFLVTGPDVGAGSGTVTLLGPGFTWGWKNTCTPTDGLQELYIYLEKPATFKVLQEPRPGGRMQLVSQKPVSMAVVQEKNRAALTVNFKEVNFTIGETDNWGIAPLTNANGVIDFGGYALGNKEMHEFSAKIIRGSGNIRIETGETSMEFVLPMQLPSGETENFVFTGYGQYKRESNTFTMDPKMTGISERFLKANVPKDTRKNKEK